MRLFHTIILSLIAITFASSCARYEAHSISKLHISSVESGENRAHPISVELWPFDRKNSLYYLGRDLLRRSIQPIQVTIYNNSEKHLILLKDRIDVESLSVEDVSKRVTTSTKIRFLGFATLGIFMWPFFIPAVMDGIKSYKGNKHLSYDYLQKSFSIMEIAPYSTGTGIIFVPYSQLKPIISVEVIDRISHEKYHFSIDLPHSSS